MAFSQSAPDYPLAPPQAGPTPALYYYGAAQSAPDYVLAPPPHGYVLAPPQAGPTPAHGYVLAPPQAPPQAGPTPVHGYVLAPPQAGPTPAPYYYGAAGEHRVDPDPRSQPPPMQSAYCDVCKIYCTCQENLNSHKEGKKHKKNLKKMESLKYVMAKEAAEEKAVVVEKMKEEEEDLVESKRRRLLGKGSTIDNFWVCTICDVVANSQTVYNMHIVGKKHAKMLNKQQ